MFYWLTSGPRSEAAPNADRWAGLGRPPACSRSSPLRAFCWLVFYDGDSISVLSPNNLGDLPLHLTYIRYLARGARFWPQNPIYSGIPLHYPAGIDIFNALLHLAGCDDFRALIWVGLAGSAVTCYALLRWGGWFAVMGSSAIAAWRAWRFFHHYAWKFQDYQQAMDWKSIPLSMFVTQRGLLYAIPAGLLLLAAWRAQWFREPDEPEPAGRMPLWVQVTPLRDHAPVPPAHLHLPLRAIRLVARPGAVPSANPKSEIRNPKSPTPNRPDAPQPSAIPHSAFRIPHSEALDLVLWAVLPATACVSLVTGLFQRGQSAASVLHLKPGWMQEDQEFFQYWFTNFGILPCWRSRSWYGPSCAIPTAPGAGPPSPLFSRVFPSSALRASSCSPHGSGTI